MKKNVTLTCRRWGAKYTYEFESIQTAANEALGMSSKGTGYPLEIAQGGDVKWVNGNNHDVFTSLENLAKD